MRGADKALVKLFGQSGNDMEVSKEGRLTFMKKRSTLLSGSLTSMLRGGSEGRGKGNKVEPEGERDIELGA